MKTVTTQEPETLEEAFQLYVNEEFSMLKAVPEPVRKAVTEAHRKSFFSGAASFAILLQEADDDAGKKVCKELQDWVNKE